MVERRCPKQRLTRRDLVRWFLGLGAGSAAASLLATTETIKPRERRAEGTEPVAAGDRLVFATGANKGQVITRESIQPKNAVLALPEGKEDNQDNLIILCRLDPAQFQPPTVLEWIAEGFVAYSAICTHLGCTVYFSHEAHDEKIPHPHLHSPCHDGLYDPLRGALVLGGPPPRPLPQLPIQINEKGEILAGGWFEEPPGVVPEEELRQWREKQKS